MTELYIDGRLAVLPEGFSFTFTSENPYFTRSSNYSMDVELPMPANYAIFKHINRLDVTKKKTILPATLIVDAKCLLLWQCGFIVGGRYIGKSTACIR